MAYLKIKSSENDETFFELARISQYDLSEFSIKNQYTGERGNTIIYPVRMHKNGFPLLQNFTAVSDFHLITQNTAENMNIL
ncbi:MAG: hypothetical protein K2G36_12065 [Ruminococcus sp.]|nr:hypothetical protein [Ruminococcus sp.]